MILVKLSEPNLGHNLYLRERLADKRARVQQIVKEAAALDNIVQSDTQSKLNLLGSFDEISETCIMLHYGDSDVGDSDVGDFFRYVRDFLMY